MVMEKQYTYVKKLTAKLLGEILYGTSHVAIDYWQNVSTLHANIMDSQLLQPLAVH